ncbi:hypothetical protein Ancab_005648 [Ancistrocladus abbreviatus]
MVCNKMAFLPPSADFFFQNNVEDHSQLPSSTSLINSQLFQGVPSLSMMKRSTSAMSLSGYNEHNYGCGDHHQEGAFEHNNNHNNNNGDDDLSDDGSQVLGEKKKRLNLEQVKTLEKNFELGNKLEPERKLQLAKALGLQPRQVGIWFQNRRARWKTKQLEKDYNLLKSQFEALKADNHSLQSLNKKLHAELVALKRKDLTEFGSINLNTETRSYWSNGSAEISSNTNLGTSGPTPTESPLSLNPSNKLPFPASLMSTQLLQRSSERDLQCPKLCQTIEDDGFCNMLGGQAAFWAWPEQHPHLH